MKYHKQGFAPIFIILAVLIVGGLVGGGIYMQSQKEKQAETNMTAEKSDSDTIPVDKDTETTSQTTTTSDSSASSMEINASMLDLMARNQSLECDWTPPGITNVKVSKVWVSGKMARSHLEATAAEAGIPIVADAIFKNDTMVSWVDAGQAGKIGFKMSKADMEKANKSLTAEQKEQAEIYMEENRYSCKPWTMDASKFEVPSDVKFY